MDFLPNIVVGQSGGPTAAINASLAGVIASAKKSEKINKVYGMLNGISGLLEERFAELHKLGEDEISLLKKTPAAYLGSCRFKLPNEENEVYDKIFEILEKYNIKYFFYIGGNDSMDTVLKLSSVAKKKNSDIRFVGVPKTIDNDLPVTDHTPGFGSAAKYIAQTVREISQDSLVYDVDSVTIVEIMGRDAGWLTCASALGRYENLGPDLIYIPERAFSFEQFIKDIKEVSKRKKNIIVAVSEGIRLEDGTYVCEAASSGAVDVFGHKYLGGTARVLESFIREEFGFKARGIELNVPQRCAGHFLSKTDIDESFGAGDAAVEFALSGKTGIMTAITRLSDAPYTTKYDAIDVAHVANLEKCVPDEFINDAGNNITDAFLKYAKPLILGEVTLEYENGLPKTLVLKK